MWEIVLKTKKTGETFFEGQLFSKSNIQQALD